MFFNLVYQQVKRVPRGMVTTYGDIAKAIGFPRHARQVGYALHSNPDNSVVPCHRVVNRFGECAPAFVFGGKLVQEQMLRDEGVEFVDGKVNLDKCLFRLAEIQ